MLGLLTSTSQPVWIRIAQGLLSLSDNSGPQHWASFYFFTGLISVSLQHQALILAFPAEMSCFELRTRFQPIGFIYLSQIISVLITSIGAHDFPGISLQQGRRRAPEHSRNRKPTSPFPLTAEAVDRGPSPRSLRLPAKGLTLTGPAARRGGPSSLCATGSVPPRQVLT